MDYKMFSEQPGLYALTVLVSLIMTLVFYASTPLLVAKLRKSSITPKKYKRLCFFINLAILFIVSLIRGSFNSFAPYLLWTTIFKNVGENILRKRGLLVLPTDVNYDETAVADTGEEE